MLVSTPPASHIYIVKPGDSLSLIAKHLFGKAGKWPWFYDANLKAVGDNPNEIYPGERLAERLGKHAAYGVLSVPTGRTYEPKHGSNGSGGNVAGKPVTVTAVTSLSGTLSCSGLETLWRNAGGNAGSAFLAAEIAEAESGGRQYATGAAGERGYWQINPDHGSLSTYAPMGNAKAAVEISDNGRNWSPWTTYTQGLYIGKC
jgi:hypothetical protein